LIKYWVLNLFFVGVILTNLCATVCFGDAISVYKENQRSVVVVFAVNKKGGEISQGSGFITKSDGVVVTNLHVINKATQIKVKVGDKMFPVENIIYADKKNDLVALKIKAKDLPSVSINYVQNVTVGEKIYVISSPRGLENTISEGLVSGMRGERLGLKLLQITAPISPGSSGSPVFNEKGEVIGVATFILEDSQNLNFAIPIDVLKDKAEAVTPTKKLTHYVDDYTKSAEHWVQIGVAHLESSMSSEALNACNRAAEIDPTYSYAFICKAEAFVLKGEYQNALQECNKAILLNPRSAEAYGVRGVVYGIKDQYREAITDLLKAVEMNPLKPWFYSLLGGNYLSLEQYQQAIKSFSKAIELGEKSFQNFSMRGMAYFKLNNIYNAMEDVNTAIEINPRDGFAYAFRGAIYNSKGNSQKAVSDFKTAATLGNIQAQQWLRQNRIPW
jgi:tetratricopeptide (TPR) repeat protein